MKKQNKNNMLAFGKATVTELNDQKLNDIKGGTNTLSCFLCVNSSKGHYQEEFKVLN